MQLNDRQNYDDRHINIFLLHAHTLTLTHLHTHTHLHTLSRPTLADFLILIITFTFIIV